MKKKLLSLLLVLIMVLGMFPMSAMAISIVEPEEPEEDPVVGTEESDPFFAASKYLNTVKITDGTAKITQTVSGDTVLVSIPEGTSTINVEYTGKQNVDENVKIEVLFDGTGKKEGTISGGSIKRNSINNYFPVGQEKEMVLTVGLKAEDGSWTDKETYTYKVVRTVHLGSLSLTYANGSAVVSNPELSTNGKNLTDEFTVQIVPGTTQLILNAKPKSNANGKVYVNGSEFTSGNAIALNDYKVSEGKYSIPVAVKYIGEGTANGSSFTLNIEENDAFPAITEQPVAETTCEKNDVVTLSVAADETKGHNLSYQWYSNNGNNGVLGMYTISGATEKNYTVPTSYASKTKYHCVVTNTVGEETYSTTSETAVVITNLTSVNNPTVEITSGGDGTYYEYGSPGRFDIVAKTTDFITFNDIVVQLYCTDKNAAEGGELVWEGKPGSMGGQNAPVDYNTQWYNGADAPNVPTGKPAGTWYYYATVSMEYDGVAYSAVSETKKVTFKPYTELIGENLKGCGSAEDPFLIESLANLEYVQALVNRGGRDEFDWYGQGGDALSAYSFEGAHFRLETDIELPENWQPIGALRPWKYNPSNGVYIHPFSGIFDGNNHKITVAEGGKPLFGYVRNATIKNLKIYGTKIADDGLISNYEVDYGPDGNSHTGIPETATIDNVTILSGTKVLGSGLLSGNASGQNTVTIKNCTVERDVIIGYELNDENSAGIGSLAGRLNGTVSNCTSYATVNGVNNVGGLVGCKGQAMGSCSITDSNFYGTINATGEDVGGIIGSGYNSNSAPNAPCVDIENCKVEATITGATNVGGILGAEGGVVQAWSGESNKGYVRNNEFRGIVTATAENGIVGGVIGYMKSLNKNNVIAGNYYASDCGADKGIGKVTIIDTSTAQDTPAWVDGVYYINTSVDDISVINAELKELNNSTYTQVSEKNSNRSDDPLGADKAKLCYTDTDLDPIATELRASGTYKAEYTEGEALDLTGIVLTVHYNRGEPETISLSDVTITGYDKNKVGQQTVTLAYSGLTATISVMVNRAADTSITVTVSVYGDDKHNSTADGNVHTMKAGNLTLWLSNKRVTLEGNATVFDAVKKALDEEGIPFTYSYYEAYNSAYIESIKGLEEFDNGPNSGWKVTVNGTYIPVGVSAYYIADGDAIVFHYTDDYTKEEGSAGGTGGTDDQTAAHEVKGLIEAIGTVTKDSGDAIKAARSAYDALTDEQKDLVPNYDDLIAAEKKYAELIKDDAQMVFTDVSEEEYYYEAVKWAVELGITKGTSSTTFSPKASCTRAQMVTFLWRAAGEPNAKSTTCAFTDVDKNAYYYEALLWAVENGITYGTSDTTFSPDVDCTRGQMAAFLYRSAKTPVVSGNHAFNDVKADAYYNDAVIWAVKQEITIGTSDTTFSPDADCTRGQMVTFLYRYLAE